jgi:hypothetical protein
MNEQHYQCVKCGLPVAGFVETGRLDPDDPDLLEEEGLCESHLEEYYKPLYEAQKKKYIAWWLKVMEKRLNARPGYRDCLLAAIKEKYFARGDQTNLTKPGVSGGAERTGC